jgi:pyridinium-3,5-bisthiocarboxylic acid mononucleotide nickel chelatase
VQGYKGLATVIEINIDDLNPQPYDYFIQNVLGVVVLDAFLRPKKKNRPITLVLVICPGEAVERFTDFLLQETSAIGFHSTSHQRGEDLWTRF